MLPREAVEQGYHVINTFDRDLYIVPFAGYYRMDRNHKGIYNNWLPNKMGNQQLPAGHPRLLGATFAVWNDLSDLLHRGNCLADIQDILAGSMDVLCGRLWGGQEREVDFDRHRARAKELGYGPKFTPPANKQPLHLKGAVKLPAVLRLDAVRPPYHLTLQEVKLTKATPGREQALFSGPEGVLLGVMKDGTIGFRRADGIEFSWDAKLPVGKAVKLELKAEPGKTRLFIDGQEVQKLTLNSFKNRDEDFAKRTRDLISTFILPLNTLGKSFQGTVSGVSVERTAN